MPSLPLAFGSDEFRMIDPPSFSSGSAFSQVFVCDFADPCDVDGRGVGEHDVQAPASVGHRGVEPVAIPLLTAITLHTGDVLADFLDRRLELGLTPSVDEDVRALLDEPLGGGQPDACRTAGDYRGLVLEKGHDQITPFASSGLPGQELPFPGSVFHR